MDYKIRAKIVSLDEGLREYENIRMIRIKSKRHTLLIMEDFMPVIGELDGDIEIVYGERSEAVRNVKGFYMHKKNDFSLLIKDGAIAFEEVLPEGQEEAEAAEE